MSKSKKRYRGPQQNPDLSSAQHSLVGDSYSQDSTNPTYVTDKLAKKFTVRRNSTDIIIMFLQSMQKDQIEKLDAIIKQLYYLQKTLVQDKKDRLAARRERSY